MAEVSAKLWRLGWWRSNERRRLLSKKEWASCGSEQAECCRFFGLVLLSKASRELDGEHQYQAQARRRMKVTHCGLRN
ncbi:unnamed protein product [Amoebophrya sp. A25]|nr:unnamed protein product [Amoebophrya sp. A25]|eukprot:GSA25T00016349001.1